MLTVACVLKSGGRYSPEWVRKLKAGVERYADVRFVCLSDVDVPCERIPLKRNWSGWWSKMNLYESLQDCLYIDLDTVVTGDVTALHRASQGFTMVSDFYWPDMGNSCALSWIGDYSFLTRAYAKNPIQIQRTWDKMPGAKIGDQGYIHSLIKPDWFDAGKVISFKKSGRSGPPKGAVLTCFHGKPKPDDKAAGWAYDEWMSL